MQRVYLKPQIETIQGLEEKELLAGSGVTGETSDGGTIGYGGVDEGGQQDPDAKPFHMISVWDD